MRQDGTITISPAARGCPASPEWDLLNRGALHRAKEVLVELATQIQLAVVRVPRELKPAVVRRLSQWRANENAIQLE